MKKIIFILFFVLIVIGCVAQNTDTINSSFLEVNGNIYLGESVSTLTSLLGSPLTKEEFYYEMDDINGYIYSYSGIQFYISEEKIDSFEISGNSYTFINSNIVVGNDINNLESLFPISYANKTISEGININLSDIDKFINIEYDLDQKITKIGIYSF